MAAEIVEHFPEADRRGRRSHGLSHLPWLGTLSGYDLAGRPALIEQREEYQLWDAGGVLGCSRRRAGRL